MSKPTKDNDTKDTEFVLTLKDFTNEIQNTLKYVSIIKSKKWNVIAEYKPDRILLCKLNRFCIDRCYNYRICLYFRQVRDFFLRFGFLLYPYSIYRDGLSVKIDTNMGFHDTRASNVIFINVVCFDEENRDNPYKSALSVSFHEFLNAMSKRLCAEYELLLASINREDLERFISQPNYLERLLSIYGKRELIPANEFMHRYIANNKDTKCLLEAIFNDDKDFRPPAVYRELYEQLIGLLGKLGMCL